MKYLLGCSIVLWLSLIASSCEKSEPAGNDYPPYDPTSYTLALPNDLFPIMEIPTDNPFTEEGTELGRRLFYDPILSADSTQSCASCHKQEYGFTDERRFSIGIDGIAGDRNAMQIINLGYSELLFWDGRSRGFEAQALEPVENPIEMHDLWPNVVDKLSRHPVYPQQFWAAFGQLEITSDLVSKAIGQFERTLLSGRSKFDLAQTVGSGVFFSDEELNGSQIFNTEKGDCFHCHGGILFSDFLFHNNGLDAVQMDLGLEKITGNVLDRGKFKTPTLRNIALTAPYMHDGRFETLEQVIDFYSDSLEFSPTIDPLMKNVHQGGIKLTQQEKDDLLAFLLTLTDTSFINNPDFSNPFE